MVHQNSPQIAKFVDKDLMILGPQIVKFADTIYQELPGACLMRLTVVVSELLPFHFFVTNFKESEFFQSFISVTRFQNLIFVRNLLQYILGVRKIVMLKI